MNKQDIIHELTYQTGIQHEAVQLILESTAIIVRDAIIRGERVVISGFGSFMPTVRKAKIAQDIGRQKSIRLPARRGVKFRPSRFIKSALDTPIQEE